MKLSPFQISMGLSLLVHGAVFGVVCVAKHPVVNVGMVPASGGMEIIEIVAEPEAKPISQPHAAVVKTVEPVPVLAAPRPAVVIPDPKSLVETKDVVPTALEDNLAVMDKLQDTAASNASERVPVTASISTTAVATPKAVVCGVGCQNNPKPMYPREARQRRQEGLVVLTLTVTQAGNAADIRVEQESGYRLLDEAALEAIKKWRFTPARVGNAAVSSQVEVPVRFKLSD
jgi:protein TonB